MRKKIILSGFIAIITFQLLFGQQPKYTEKHFVSTHDTNEFKVVQAPKNGFGKYYILTEPETWDVDDNITTHVRGGGKTMLICIEGLYKNNKKNGVFNFFLIDSVNHSRRYKIWQQSYANDKLNGEWKTYNLKGTVIRTQQYQNDSLNGLSRDYWIDGKTIMEEKEFFKGRSKYIMRTFYKSGKPEAEQSYENGVANGLSKKYYESGKLSEHITIKGGIPDGPAKRYYEDGTIKEEVTFANGQFNNVRKYYYPNGKLWIEQEYNNGLPWTVISNHDENGNKRNAGTLKNGNGTLILYNEDGTVRETLTYENGKEK